MAPFELIFDADGHVVESDRELYDYLPPPYPGETRLFAAPFFPPLGRGFIERRCARLQEEPHDWAPTS